MTTNLFKKTLVAAALVSVSAGAFAGATVGSTPVGLSVEASSSANTIEMNAITITLDAEYAIGDILTLSVNGSAAVSSTWPNTISVAEVTETAPGAGDGIAGLTLGLLSGTADGATYRVTDLADTSQNEDDTTVGAVISIDAISNSALELRRNQAVEAGVVRVTYSAETQTGVSLDSTGPNLVGELAVAGEEFFVSLPSASRLGDSGSKRIAIEFGRRAFEGATTVDTFDPALVQETNAYRDARDLVGVAFDQGSAVDLVTYTLEGDFSWVPNMSAPQTSISAGGTCTLDYANGAVSETTVTATATAAGTCSIVLDLNDGLPGFAPMAIEPQDFTYSMVLEYTDGGAAYDGVAGQERTKTLAEDAFAGTWVLNSFNTTIGYMPFGSSVSQIIYLTNTGSTVGDIFVDAWAQDGTLVLDNENVGTTTAAGITQLSQVIRTALQAEGISNEKVRIRIIADIPSAQGRVFSAYNVAGDRLATGNF